MTKSIRGEFLILPRILVSMNPRQIVNPLISRTSSRTRVSSLVDDVTWYSRHDADTSLIVIRMKTPFSCISLAPLMKSNACRFDGRRSSRR